MFFMNIFDPGHMLAVWGPFPAASEARPKGPGPRVTAELRELAERLGVRPLELAAYDRLALEVD